MHLLLSLLLLFSLNALVACGKSVELPTGGNLFTPKAFLMRYWSKEIRNGLPKSSFLLSKASPWSAVDWAAFTKLVAENSLSSRLPEFYSAAKLLCFPDLSPILAKHSENVNFAVYSNRNFTNYGTDQVGRVDSFRNYSENKNIPVDSFRRYSRQSTSHADEFSSYATDGNVVDRSFNTYATEALAGAGKFTLCANNVNVPNVQFTSYSFNSDDRPRYVQRIL